MAVCNAGNLGVFSAEGSQCRRAKRTESGRVPRGGSEGVALNAEDERVGNGVVSCGVEGKGDLFSFLLPVGVPGLCFFAVPLLLEDRGSVGGELKDDIAMHLLRNAAATGIEAFELRGVSGRESCAKKDESGDSRMESHGAMVLK